jgi:hypothetical protein
MQAIRKLAWTDGDPGPKVASGLPARRSALTHTDLATTERPDVRIPREWLSAGDAECECPDVCPIQHDDN